MTAPLPADSSRVPATFLSVQADDQRDEGRWGWSLAALTGPLAAPAPVTGVGEEAPWSRRRVRLPDEAVPGRGRRKARQLPQPASGEQPRGEAGSRTSTPARDHDRDRVRTPPALAAGDRRRLLAGAHPDPHAHLGAYITPEGGVCFRTLRPGARSVTVLAAKDERRAELRAVLRDEGAGFFAGEVTVPGGEIPSYELLVQYGERPGEDDLRVADPYRLPPAVGEFEVRLIREGRHEQLWRALGARTMTHRGVAGTRFTLWAPHAQGMRVVGDFNRWDGTSHPMRSLDASGVWELFVPGVGDGAVYVFEATGEDGSRVRHADPMAGEARVPHADGSVVHTSAHRWRDGDWLDRRGAGRPHAAPLSVCELHLPSWRPGLGYRELAAQLPTYVGDLGFTHVELMPSGKQDSCEPAAPLGGPDDFKYLIDALHRAGIGVIMDWVPVRRFGLPGVPPGFLVADAVRWCEEFHVDGLRVGVASVHHGDGSTGPDAVALLQELNATLHQRFPGVITVAEESAGFDGVTRPTHLVGESGLGGLGFSFKWDTRWMHGSLGYASREAARRAHHHEQLTGSMAHAYSENHLLPLPHREVTAGDGSLVTRMPGDPWQQRAGHRAHLGFMWAHPGKQLLFMGRESGQEAERPEAYRGVRDLVRDLNAEYLRCAALWQQDADPAGFSWIEDGSSGTGPASGESVFAFLRYDAGGSPLLAVSNFSSVPRPGHRLGVPDARTRWREVLNTDGTRYGGSGTGNSAPLTATEHPSHGLPASITPTLPPLATLWLRPA